MSRRPATTPLLNGQATKVRFASMSVTEAFGNRRFTSRAQVAPAKPPPTTTTRGAAWPKLGRGRSGAAAAVPRALRMLRRFGLKRMPAPLALRRQPRRDSLRLRLGKALGDA